MRNKQKGFGLVPVLLVLLLVSAIGFAGYYVWNTQNSKKGTSAIVSTPTNSTEPISKNTSPIIKLAKYCSINEKACFEYPESWKLVKYNQENYVESVKITTDNGSVVSYGVGGQLGGGCDKSQYPLSNSNNSEILYSNQSSVVKDGYVIDRLSTLDGDLSERISLYSATDDIQPVVGKHSYCDNVFSYGFEGRNYKGAVDLDAEVKDIKDRQALIKVMESYKYE